MRSHDQSPCGDESTAGTRREPTRTAAGSGRRGRDPEEEYRGHPRNRTQRGSTGRTLLFVLGGVGLSVVLLSVAFVLLLVYGDRVVYGTEIKLKGGSQLYYTSSVGEPEARKLADFLNENLLSRADARPGSFQLSKNGNTYELRVCVREGAEKDNLLSVYWLCAAHLMSEKVFDKAPVQVYLCDDQLKVIHTIPLADGPKPAGKT